MRYGVVLAAGKGTRMRSDRPKPLVEVCGLSMVGHVLAALGDLDDLSRIVVVVGHEAEAVEAEVQRHAPSGVEVVTAYQFDQRGTGDAVRVALTRLPDLLPGVGSSGAEVVVVPSDAPLLTATSLRALLATHAAQGNAATVLTMELDDPSGYGRILRARDGKVRAIVEQADLDDDRGEATREVNTGVYVFDLAVLPSALRLLAPTNRQREYYLTDSIALLAESGYRVGTLVLDDPTEALGVNDRLQLADVAERMRARIVRRLLHEGVQIQHPSTVTVDARVRVAEGVVIEPQVALLGATRIEANALIGAHSRLVDTVVGQGAQLRAVDACCATIGEWATVGPFSVLETGAVVEPKGTVPPFARLP
ncbi:Nucleotidyl transferase [Acidimicrobium ferrooxidans DSM 10331]|uniref:Nucleotidyl transferase n=1 Tax=Acidimicrobium ferrooxidans (strain DSM 10331 / JCM 15462 / NBRC 103882 / ICP) TaxID=525909 RepID=C7M0L3_ACIFD|nr:NTP transferase domain-containing protein [Acidimicrobium ferrooxidans]ACU54521.1 Nucleotidyl transferase [Acidimicrobium ferrooxidans DSM 10331]